MINATLRVEVLCSQLVLHMLTEICEAVYSCHQKKIIHRDLKPENVLLDHRRRVKLGGFALGYCLCFN